MASPGFTDEDTNSPAPGWGVSLVSWQRCLCPPAVEVACGQRAECSLLLVPFRVASLPTGSGLACGAEDRQVIALLFPVSFPRL